LRVARLAKKHSSLRRRPRYHPPVDPTCCVPEERYFKALGPDEASQVINWLNEIVFFFDTDGLYSSNLISTSGPSPGLSDARGERFDIDRHEFRTAVKAATYHQFESGQTNDGWEIRVFLDV
jgi:SHS2 domain-containing protein